MRGKLFTFLLAVLLLQVFVWNVTVPGFSTRFRGLARDA